MNTDTNFDIASRNSTGLEIAARDRAEFESLRAEFSPTSITTPEPTIKQQVYKGVDEIKTAPVGWYWARYYATGAPGVILISRRVYDNDDGETTCLNFDYPNEVYLTARATNETHTEEAYLVIFGPLEIPHF